MRRILLTLAAPTLLLLVGCSDDDGGGDIEAFCDLLRASEDEELDPTTDEGREAFEALIDAAPSELDDDLRVFGNLMEELEGLDEDDPEAMEAVFGVMFDPEVIAAGENLEQFGVEECGFEPDDDEGDLDFELDDTDDAGDTGDESGSE